MIPLISGSQAPRSWQKTQSGSAFSEKRTDEPGRTTSEKAQAEVWQKGVPKSERGPEVSQSTQDGEKVISESEKRAEFYVQSQKST
jgi:hypothetical protein